MENSLFLGVPILKHITVLLLLPYTCNSSFINSAMCPNNAHEFAFSVQPDKTTLLADLFVLIIIIFLWYVQWKNN